MNTQKTKPYRSKKYTQAAKGQSCIRCFIEDGTICARHYNSQRQHIYGKGWGVKVSDLAVADLCQACDRLFTEGQREGFDDKNDRSEQFLHLVLLTIMRRVEQGVLK